jgi:hypothetical protein
MRNQRIEFCLVSAERTSRWEFPHIEIGAADLPLEAARRVAVEQTGLVCRISQSEPLDDVLATQDRRLVQLISFLLEVDEASSGGGLRRIRWCLPEEARARIRRKPMRRLIDLALRRQPEQPDL